MNRPTGSSEKEFDDILSLFNVFFSFLIILFFELHKYNVTLLLLLF